MVFHNPVLGSETHLSNTCRKSITCLTFSSDGRYLGTGECGHQSNVRVWDMTDFIQIAEFSGHKYGINCVVSLKFYLFMKKHIIMNSIFLVIGFFSQSKIFSFSRITT